MLYRRTRRRHIEAYLARGGSAKLHIGSGAHELPGWLNGDLSPRGAEIFLDATVPFPFSDAVFDYVYSHHLIEHIPFSQGLRMLVESYRVLKTGGRIRIATPDLAFLVGLYRDARSPLEQRYIEWSIRRFVPDAPATDATFVINNFVRNWGHRFIYDENTLGLALKSAGFSAVRRFDLNDSQDDALRGLENADRMPEGFLELETMVLEAEKTAAPGTPV